MKKKPKKQLKFGLIGQNISYSFSEKYFTEKFEMGHYDNCEYANYDLNNIQNLSELIQIKGMGNEKVKKFGEKILEILKQND